MGDFIICFYGWLQIDVVMDLLDFLARINVGLNYVGCVVLGA